MVLIRGWTGVFIGVMELLQCYRDRGSAQKCANVSHKSHSGQVVSVNLQKKSCVAKEGTLSVGLVLEGLPDSTPINKTEIELVDVGP